MDPERWKQIEQLYHAALEREESQREAFLEKACGADQDLRQEVESLLEREQKAEGFIEKPALEIAAKGLAEDQMLSVVGRKIGSYEVLSLLGRGGMGEVYLAEDTSLERRVALKFLPEYLHADEVARKRFMREAKSAAAIEHPFICNIKEVAQTDEGQDFIVMEYVEGQTLKDRLEEGPLPIKEALQIGSEVAQALERAHNAGVIHRDLKPTNIMLTLDGHPKVMDFGLAKRVTRDKEDLTSVLTREGTTLGTLAYMSPEQLRGSTVDTRADVFSLGVVLYEMLTGVHPFSTGTQAETVNAILSEHPSPLSRYVEGVPDLLQHTIKKMLAKQPGERYQTVHEIRTNLTKVMEEITSPTPLAEPDKRAGRWISVAAVVALGIASIATWWYLTSLAPREPAEPFRVIPFTAEPGQEYHPSFSPDGTQIAYVRAVGDGRTEIHLRLVGGQQRLRLTDGVGQDLHPVWSPDGTRIAFTRKSAEESGLFVVEAFGGEARRLLPLDVSLDGLSWHGDSLAFTERDSPERPHHISLLSTSTREKRKLTSPTAVLFNDRWPQFSPDGKHLAFARGMVLAQDVYIIPVAGGEPKRLTEMVGAIAGIAWTADGEEIVFSFAQGESRNLWRVSISGEGDPQRVAPFVDGALHPAIAARENRLAFTEWASTSSADIFRLELKNGKSDDPVIPLIASTLRDVHPHISPDGTQIAFSSDRAGGLQVYVCNSDGTNSIPITNLDSPDNSGPWWSPDGKRIAFTSMTQEGHYDIYVTDLDGGTARRLTTDPQLDSDPRFSRDGKWIYFQSARSGRNEIWKIPAEGGEAIQVTMNGGMRVEESLDREHLYYVKGQDRTLWRRPITGGGEVLVSDNVRPPDWCLGESGIYVLERDAKPLPCIRLFDSESLKPTTIVELSEDAATAMGSGHQISVSPGDAWLVYQASSSSEQDIKLVENFR
jgi:Tol biopolymer transport system component/serine/threonine protein kinase